MNFKYEAQGGSVGNLVIINNNNNNNNIDEEMFDINELALFLSVNKNLTLEDLLHGDITQRLDEFFNKDKKDINSFLKDNASKNLSN